MWVNPRSGEERGAIRVGGVSQERGAKYSAAFSKSNRPPDGLSARLPVKTRPDAAGCLRAGIYRAYLDFARCTHGTPPPCVFTRTGPMPVVKTALSVNLNKVALLRNARDLDVPSVERAARICLDAGADGLDGAPAPGPPPHPPARRRRARRNPRGHRRRVQRRGQPVRRGGARLSGVCRTRGAGERSRGRGAVHARPGRARPADLGPRVGPRPRRRPPPPARRAAEGLRLPHQPLHGRRRRGDGRRR